ncbi:MAG: glyoxylate/hydroxypyruvate reductase A [Bacteroidia bacterium]|nr:MAG: glyoxylate/hydroxypyruvate reductase A [Bacteroidia bacterium]
MSILIVSPGKKLNRWKDALKAVDPSVAVFLPEEVKNPLDITFALSWNHPKKMFRKYPNLKCISSFGAGVDHLLSDTQIPMHVEIVRIIDPLLSKDMFEFALAVVMKHLRKLTRYTRYQEASIWKKHEYLRMQDIQIGIMGTGMIGHHVASELQRVGFRVAGWNRTGGQPTSYDKYHGTDQLNDFLKVSDVLICLLPLTRQTRGIINYSLLRELPVDAYVINFGRGAHVNERDLIRAIDEGHISGAHLDVFEEEPLPENHLFWQQPGIDITPHVASLTDPDSIAPQVMDNYHRSREGSPLNNLVSRDLGY